MDNPRLWGDLYNNIFLMLLSLFLTFIGIYDFIARRMKKKETVERRNKKPLKEV